jgi:hypothetical protein
MIRKSDFSKCLDPTARREGGIFGRSSPAKSRAVRFRRWCLPTFSPAERLFLRRRLSRFEAEEAGVVAPMYVVPVSGNGAEALLSALLARGLAQKQCADGRLVVSMTKERRARVKS